MNPETFARVFPLGSHLCREPMPAMSEMKKDMENLKRHGFNLIKLQEHWQVDEPAEQEYDFSRYEELIEHAARLDLGVYLGLTCEQAPAWLFRKYPDCRMVGRDGRVMVYEAPATLPADGKPGPCFDHPGALADMKRFISELVQTLGRYENVVIWNTWQEIGYWSVTFIGSPVCYCPHTLAFFRKWLGEKYGDLGCLNRAWNTRYRKWADVVPSRSASDNAIFGMAVDVHWEYFMHNIQMARVLKERAAAIRAADPRQRPVFAHRGAPVIGGGEDWTYARCQDFLGASCYPSCGAGVFDAWDDWMVAGLQENRAAGLLKEILNNVVLRFDYVRSCNKAGVPIWAAEFQGGPHVIRFQKARVPSPADIRRWMLSAAGSGVTAISFWVTRAEIAAAEGNGYSLLDSAGDTTPRYEEAARIGQAFNRHADLFAAATLPPSSVAIVVNEWNYLSCKAFMGEKIQHLPYAIRGWHRLLWELGIAADFVEINSAPPEKLAEYKSLIMPFPVCLAEENAAKLCRYAAGGGHLISEAVPGWINENGFCNRGEMSPALREMFGVRHESLTMVREPGNGRRWTAPDRCWNEYMDPLVLEGSGILQGHSLRPNLYLQTFVPTNAEVCLLAEGRVAGVTRRIDRGRGWLLGTFVGHNGMAYRNDATPLCIKAMLSAAGVMPDKTGPLVVRKRILPDKEAWIFINQSDQPAQEYIDIAGWRQAEDLLGEKLRRDGNRLLLAVDGLDARAIVLAR